MYDFFFLISKNVLWRREDGLLTNKENNKNRTYLKLLLFDNSFGKMKLFRKVFNAFFPFFAAKPTAFLLRWVNSQDWGLAWTKKYVLLEMLSN